MAAALLRSVISCLLPSQCSHMCSRGFWFHTCGRSVVPMVPSSGMWKTTILVGLKVSVRPLPCGGRLSCQAYSAFCFQQRNLGGGNDQVAADEAAMNTCAPKMARLRQVGVRLE